MDAIHEEVLNGLTINIFQDDFGDSPNSWGDENMFLVGYHRDFGVDSKHFSKEELIAYFEGDKEGYNVEYFKKFWVFPLSAYIHSGVKLYLGSHKVCQWDSCQVGAVLIAKEEARTEKKARVYAEGQVDTWNDYLSGNVYGFQITDEQRNDVESVWGFYGDYEEGALVEARSIVNHVTNKGATESNGQLLLKF